MGKWLDLLAAQPATRNAAPPHPLTVKTAKRGSDGVADGADGAFDSFGSDPGGVHEIFRAPSPALAVSHRRPYRLTPALADAAHASPWSDAAIARFQARVADWRRPGFSASDAEDLAERLHLAEHDDDDRRPCLACRHLAGSMQGWLCRNRGAASLNRAELAHELVTLPQRCAGFQS